MRNQLGEGYLAERAMHDNSCIDSSSPRMTMPESGATSMVKPFSPSNDRHKEIRDPHFRQTSEQSLLMAAEARAGPDVVTMSM